jgi:hypothetical protein
MKWGRIIENRKNIPGVATESPEPDSATPAPVKASPADELEKLAELRDQGVITEEEFEAKKKQVLDL